MRSLPANSTGTHNFILRRRARRYVKRRHSDESNEELSASDESDVEHDKENNSVSDTDGVPAGEEKLVRGARTKAKVITIIHSQVAEF